MFFSEYQISKVIASRISHGKHIIYFTNDYNIKLNVSILQMNEEIVLASNTSRMTSLLYLVSVKDWRSGNLSKCLLSNLSNPSCLKINVLYQNPTNHFLLFKTLIHKSYLQKLN